MARSVLGRKTMVSSARFDELLRKVVTLMIFVERAVSLRFATRDQSTGCASAMLLPQRMIVSAFSMSS